MKACNEFLCDLKTFGHFETTDKVVIDLYGSLALTGKGHATDHACLLGLSGMKPDAVVGAPALLAAILSSRVLHLGGTKPITFKEESQLKWNFERKKEHSNALTLTSFDSSGDMLYRQTYFSIGGGFIRTLDEMHASQEEVERIKQENKLDLHFRNMAELLTLCDLNKMSIADVMRHNEREKGLTDDEIDDKLDKIWSVMNDCIERGLHSTEIHLPGKLGVKRRAARLFNKERAFARSGSFQTMDQPYLPMLNSLSKVSMYAIAVNEENAGGWSQIVTAPTNGASGIIPSCIKHLITDMLHPRYTKTLPKELYKSHDHALIMAPRIFLLTAAAVGALFKQNASISGAEAGCQGEVGVASSMAAAGLVACLGGNANQCENAAEMAMEHSLGLTCDPIEGLVQIPCIERNAMGATKAMNAATMALMSDDEHHVPFDSVVQVMKKIGEDMKLEYKETSLGGLSIAANIRKSSPAC